jgi:hypothetical protein
VSSTPCLEPFGVQIHACLVCVHLQGRAAIQSYFFCESPGCDLVLVTSEGLELHQLAANRLGLRLRDRSVTMPSRHVAGTCRVAWLCTPYAAACWAEMGLRTLPTARSTCCAAEPRSVCV